MLNTVTAADFEPLLGQDCVLDLTPELSVRLDVEQVKRRPECQVPGHEEARTPFDVLLTGREGEAAFHEAVANLHIAEGVVLESVYICRVMPPGGEMARPWYQLVFN
ncbi:DUF6916 family protein [Halomonas organivorans]|uniref:DUF6916 domain-containing protein n=1 Tax=Halomonas organivorans TaxID=257772 RepID=A0A7W5G486_9GAMM|nr:hypothetical protein [Halomonas organivorans]MBB3139670.1 hypothetical protein [Halomonas organivorans]